MKHHFVLCALAALVLFQAAAYGFKVKRVIYVVSQTNTTTEAPATNSTTVAPPVIVYCTWKNNWCRPASNAMRNCKWGLCKFYG
ncbi:uncharacterized protein [Drosophila kikkawai]|uniref:Uncharacterized protein n=1 Tax=Drosophila kikkawai TaxID=30033 RepID=A0A6P4IKJ0_DROKI|nr:uncharacterized protein LOC108075224 [Drosophila kikkawai]